MKEIRETKMVEQTTVRFIADDGKEFDNELDCKNYEQQKNAKQCEIDFLRLNPIFLNSKLFEWFSCDARYIVLTMEKESDFYALQNYVKSSYRYAEFEVQKPKEYPATKVYSLDEGYCTETRFSPEDITNELNRLLQLI